MLKQQDKFSIIVAKFIFQSSQNAATEKKKEKISDIMVECPTCKTFVSKKEGILSNGNYFCSVECLNNKG